MKISDETKVGVLTVVGLTILILGFSFLKGEDLFKKEKTLVVIYDKIEGLSVSDAVMINGFKVGKVSQLNLDLKTSKIVAILTIQHPDLIVPKGSIASIVSTDLLGTKAIDMQLSDSDIPTVDGDTILSHIDPDLMETVLNDILAPVQVEAVRLMGTLDSVMEEFKIIFKEDDIPNIFKNLSGLTANLERASVSLDSLLAMDEIGDIILNLEGFTKTLADNEANIDAILGNLASLTDSLAGAEIPALISSLDSTLREAKTLLQSINQGEGTIASLINDPELYNELTQSMANLDSLLADIKARPDRYIHISVFGKKNKD